MIVSLGLVQKTVATMDITDHAIVGGVPEKILKVKSND